MRKMIKRTLSPGPGYESEGGSTSGRSSPSKGKILPDEDYDSSEWAVNRTADMSEVDLRLELARQNSQSQQGKPRPVEKDIPERESQVFSENVNTKYVNAELL